jgi:hypothetical protein
VNRPVSLLAAPAAAVLVAAVLAGCGNTSKAASVYDRAKTRQCLADAKVRIGGPLDFVASTATGGAFRAKLPDNAVTIVFGQSIDDANNIDQAYVHFHAKNVGIADVLRQQGNAVMLWHEHPSDQDLNLVEGCLEG